MKFFIAALLASAPVARATDVFRIEVGRSPENYSQEDLRRRVWELERAVSQLQDQVFQLSARRPEAPRANPYTCRMQSFGKSFVVTANTRSAAVAQILKQCADATNAVHCHESDVSCGND